MDDILDLGSELEGLIKTKPAKDPAADNFFSWAAGPQSEAPPVGEPPPYIDTGGAEVTANDCVVLDEEIS